MTPFICTCDQAFSIVFTWWSWGDREVLLQDFTTPKVRCNSHSATPNMEDKDLDVWKFRTSTPYAKVSIQPCLVSEKSLQQTRLVGGLFTWRVSPYIRTLVKRFLTPPDDGRRLVWSLTRGATSFYLSIKSWRDMTGWDQLLKRSITMMKCQLRAVRRWSYKCLQVMKEHLCQNGISFIMKGRWFISFSILSSNCTGTYVQLISNCWWAFMDDFKASSSSLLPWFSRRNLTHILLQFCEQLLDCFGMF